MKPIALALFATLLRLVASATPPVVHITNKPAWISPCKNYDKKPALRDVENGYFYALLEEQVQVEQQASYTHVIREIVSEAGVQNSSTISVRFDPVYEKLDFHDITVWRDNKPQSRLKASSFKVMANEEELSMFIYQGTYAALCILEDIRKGDRIEYSYTLTGRNPIFSNHYAANLYLQYSQPISHQYTALITTPARKLTCREFNNAPRAVITSNNGTTKYEWETFDIPGVTVTNEEPSWYDPYVHVQVSDFNNWGQVVNWALQVNPIPANPKGQLAEQVTRLKTSAGDDKTTYFRNAVSFVQDDIRYMGIETGEYSHRANTPEKVFAQRYGDCKDKSQLLVALLRADGIEAYIVLINTSLKSHILDYDSVPAGNLFNHAIVVAIMNGKQCWIDPTITYQGGTGTDLFFPDYQRGLILKPGITDLTAIPTSNAGKIACDETYTITDEKTGVDLTVETIYTSKQADRIRNTLAASSQAETERSYLDYYGRIYSKIERVDSLTVKDNREKNEITTIEHYRISNFFKQDSTTGKFTAGFYANYIAEALPKIAGQSKTPIGLVYPYTLDYTLHVSMPEDWQIPEKKYDISRQGYQFNFDKTTEGTMLALHYQLSFLADNIPVEKMDEFAGDIKDIRDNRLSFNFFYNPGAKQTGSSSRLNIWLIFFALMLTGLFAWIGVRIYKKETASHAAGYIEPKPIGGWLILIGLGLAFTPLRLLWSFITGSFFHLNIWNAYGTGTEAIPFKSVLTFEVAGNTFLICYAVFCLVLLLEKRDILPKLIIGLYAFNVGFVLLDWILAATLITTNSSDYTSNYQFIRTVVYATIWTSYFLKADRVKETFVVTYPRLTEQPWHEHQSEHEPQPEPESDQHTTTTTEEPGQNSNEHTAEEPI
ncbi:hypothetical protein F5148DRAFT_1289068 [Russula earlei]|uniref:Uncharacterized protein n=1 Tax=Russula earlei TaxID=71964 RepID=A0ACC0U0M4_9AGAM|nr:hypothetical protein F5148DRAFT_1289068 [Russula earlei]